MAKKNGDTKLAPSVGSGWDAWGASCGFTSWEAAANALGITRAQMITNRKKDPRKTIRLAMDAVLANRSGLIEAAMNASATLGNAYHTVLTGELAEAAHDAYQRLDAALWILGE